MFIYIYICLKIYVHIVLYIYYTNNSCDNYIYIYKNLLHTHIYHFLSTRAHTYILLYLLRLQDKIITALLYLHLPTEPY